VRGFATTYRVTLEAAEDADATPPALRLRAALKIDRRGRDLING
jgi:hypothetical protein